MPSQPNSPHSLSPPQLTERELEVLRLQSNGHTNIEIADNLNIGVSTIKKHVQSILKKLGACNTSHALVLSIKHGFLEL